MELMMNMSSSSASRNSDLIRRKSSNSSASTNHPITSATLQMTNNNQQPQPPLLDAQITLLDAPATETVAASGDDVWKEFVGGRSCKQEVPDEMMTLEDFLAKAGAVEEQQEEVEDVKVPPIGGRILGHPSNVNVNVDAATFGIGAEEIGGGRGKRRAILETLDKAAQQRQRRMIKNRESAARSRERKQAYQAELESLAVKLEEENGLLLKAKTEQTRKRYKQLMDNIIPVTEKQKPRRCVLKKVRSMEW